MESATALEITPFHGQIERESKRSKSVGDCITNKIEPEKSLYIAKQAEDDGGKDEEDEEEVADGWSQNMIRSIGRWKSMRRKSRQLWNRTMAVK